MFFSIFKVFSDSSSGIGALGINGQAFLIQLVTFLIVFLALKKWAFKPILKVLKQRRELIENGVKLGQDMQKKSEELGQEVADKLHKARTEADQIIGEASSGAKDIVQRAEETAKAKSELIFKDAQSRISQETSIAKERLEKELVGLISEATEAIIDEKVDAKKDILLINNALKGVKS